MAQKLIWIWRSLRSFLQTFLCMMEETFKQEKLKIILDNILNSSIFNLA